MWSSCLITVGDDEEEGDPPGRLGDRHLADSALQGEGLGVVLEPSAGPAVDEAAL